MSDQKKVITVCKIQKDLWGNIWDGIWALTTLLFVILLFGGVFNNTDEIKELKKKEVSMCIRKVAQYF
ncbi:MAG: hypothetical protein V3V31_16220 [Methylococcales bacterium]